MKKYIPPVLLLVVALLFAYGPSLPLGEIWKRIPIPVAPIAEPGFRVLIVYESENLSGMTEAQKAAIWGAKVTQYLQSKCTKGIDNTNPDFRRLDQNADVSKDAKYWQDAMALPRDSLPWVVISTGKTGFKGPLPATEDEMLALLKKYGG